MLQSLYKHTKFNNNTPNNLKSWRLVNMKTTVLFEK